MACQIGAPCRFCMDREIGCHSTCKSYLDWKNDREKTKKRYYNYIEGIYIDIERARKYKQRRRYKKTGKTIASFGKEDAYETGGRDSDDVRGRKPHL